MSQRHNKGAWRALGFKPKSGEKPEIVKWSCPGIGRGEHHYYNEDQVEPIRRRTKKAAQELPLTDENIIAATQAVNWAAKRRRDAASSQYYWGNHGLARHNKNEKIGLYCEKDRGISELIKRGVLTAKEKHGDHVLWEGQGVSFHSRIHPENPVPEVQGNVKIPSKTVRGAMRLIDARHLLKKLA
jgi:hypothetical protein